MALDSSCVDTSVERGRHECLRGNEAIFGGGGFRFNGFGDVFDEFFELVEGADQGALGGLDAFAETFVVARHFEGKAGGTALIGVAEVVDLAELGFPEFAFDAVVAAEEPGVADQGIDEGTSLRGDGVVLAVILLDEFVEIFFGLASDDGGFGVETGFERIHARGGLTLGGAGAGRIPRVPLIGGALLFGCHCGPFWGVPGRWSARPTFTVAGEFGNARWPER